MVKASQVARYADAAMEACWLVIVAIAPLHLDLLRHQQAAPRAVLVQLLATVLAALWLVRQLARRNARVADESSAVGALPRPAVWLASAFALTTALAAALSPLPFQAFWGSYERADGVPLSFAYAVLFLVVADRLHTRAQWDRLVTVLLATTLPLASYAVVQSLGLDPLVSQGGAYEGRAGSTIGNPLFLAAYLALLIPLTIGRLVTPCGGGVPASSATRTSGSWAGPGILLLGTGLLAIVFLIGVRRPDVWYAAPALIAAFALAAAMLPPLPKTPRGRYGRRLGYLGLLALQLMVLVLSGSRGPTGALLLALIVTLAAVGWQQRAGRQLAAAGGLLLLAALIIATLNLPESPLAPVKEHAPVLQRLGELQEFGLGQRLAVWQAIAAALPRFTTLWPADDPAAAVRVLVGYGSDTQSYLLNPLLPPDPSGEYWDRAHNVVLDRLLTTGLLGTLAYVGFVGTILVVALRRALEERRRTRGWARTFVFGALLTFVLENQLGLFTIPGSVVFCVLAGAALARGWDLWPPAVAKTPQQTVPSPAVQQRVMEDLPDWMPLALYVSTGLIAVVILIGLTGRVPAEVGTAASALGLLLAPFVGGFVLLPQPWPAAWRRTLLPVAGLVVLFTWLVHAAALQALAADTYFKQGERLHLLGDHAASVGQVREALRLAPARSEYHDLLAQDFAYLAAAAPPGAAPGLAGQNQLLALSEESLREALRRDPLDPRLYLRQGELYVFWAALADEPERLTTALASFERAAALKPNDADVYTRLAQTLLLHGDPAGAIAAGQHAVALLPAHWLAHAVVAEAYLRVGDSAAAAQSADIAIANAQRLRGPRTVPRGEIERLQALREQAAAAHP